MSDTSPEMRARHRALVLARSGEERLRMAGAMYATARALVVASVREAQPAASAAELRQAIFLRFYGREFDGPTRARILARLATPMRRVSVDWDMLETSLTWRDGEYASYLDLRTGEIRLHPCAPFGGRLDEHELSEDDVAEGEATGDLIHIRPIDSSEEYRWMADFAASIGDGRLRDRVGRALTGRRPFRHFKDALGEHRPTLERWFRFHEARVREATRQWLAEHAIEPTGPPPARGRSGQSP